MAFRQRRGSGGRRAILLLLPVLAASTWQTTAADQADAAKPNLGSWQGTGPDGGQIAFRVMRVKGGGGRAVAYLAQTCPGVFESGNTYVSTDTWADGYWWDAPSDRMGPANALAVRRRGKVSMSDRSDFSGRLGRSSGRVRVGWVQRTDDRCEGRFSVRHVDEAVTPASGVWQARGPVGTDFRFLVFGSLVNTYTGWVLTGQGTVQGAPVPCIIPLHFADSPGQLPAWTDGAGAFSYVDEQEPPRSISARFDSPVSLAGSYLIDSGYGLQVTQKCVDLEFPYSATLSQAAPPPRLHGRELVDEGGPPPAPPVILPTPRQPTPYVAVGDSYSSGEGVPPFEPGTDERGHRCHRSTGAYPRLISPPGYTMQTTFLACSGATSINLGRLVGGSWVAIPQKGEAAAQLAALTLEQWRPTDLITITVGGNDARFDQVLKRCLRPRTRCQRGEWARAVEDRIATELPVSLAETYAAIRSRVPIREGGNTTVVVLGYPQLFPGHPRKRCPIRKKLWLTEGEQDWLRERGEQLTAVIRAEASRPELRFHFVDVTRAFAGHEVCGRDRDWLHGLVPKAPPNHRYSFHPNARGQRAYADRLLAYFSCLYTNGFGFRASGVPYNPGGPNGLVVPSQCVGGG